MSVRVTKKMVVDYHEYMARRFNFTVIEKTDSDLMPIVSRALDVFGIMDKDTFLKRYATTVVDPFLDRKWVYIPWVPGVGSQSSRAAQMRVLSHETEHTIQGEDINFILRYARSRSKRAHYEALATQAELETHCLLTGKPLNVSYAANRLKAYGVRAADIDVTKQHLALVNMVVVRGAVGTAAGKATRQFLRRYGG